VSSDIGVQLVFQPETQLTWTMGIEC